VCTIKVSYNGGKYYACANINVKTYNDSMRSIRSSVVSNSGSASGTLYSILRVCEFTIRATNHLQFSSSPDMCWRNW